MEIALAPAEGHTEERLTPIPPTLLARLFADEAQRTELPNGLVVLLAPEAGTGLASVQTWVRTGSIHEGPWLGCGLSHYLEHMLFKGTAKRPGSELARAVQAMGGYINAYTTFDRTVYYIDCPTEGVAEAVDLLADAVLNATLDPAEAARERDVILREIDMTLDDPDQELGRVVFRTAFRQHPCRHPIIGYRELFAATTAADLRAYYEARYAPNNCVVVVAGDFDPAATLAAIESSWGSAPRRRLAPVLIPDEPPHLGPRHEALSREVEVCRGALAWRIPGFSHADGPALDLLASILGQGASSILWQRLREKRQLVHHIDCACWNPGEVGLFWVSFACANGTGPTVLAAIAEEVHRLLHEPGALEAARLARAQRQAIVGEVNARRTVSGMAGRLGSAEVVAGDLHFPRQWYERLRALHEPAALLAVGREHLHPARTTTVLLDTPAQWARPVRHRAAPPPFGLQTLPNGARLLLQPDPTQPKVALRLAALGGPVTETPGHRGLTALMATLLTKDAAGRTAEDIAARIESVGGSLTEFAGNNAWGIAVETLGADFPLALATLRDAALHPSFLAPTVARERAAQAANLREDEDDALEYARRQLRRHAFGDHPYAIGPGGLPEDVEQLSVAEVVAHHAARLRAAGTVLAVCGDFDPVAVRPALEAFLAELPAGPSSFAPPPFGLCATLGRRHLKRSREQAIVFAAYAGPGVLAPDIFVAEVLDELFSDMAGRLFTRVREELGLAYFVAASRLVGYRDGLFTLYAGTRPDAAATVLAEFDAAVQRIADGGVTEGEVARARRRLAVAKRSSLQSLGARTLQASLNTLYGIAADDWVRYPEHLAAVTPASLAEFAQRRLAPSQRLELIVGP